ncbi:MAG: Type 1 glutamine amidotransferase-like domain-containing protein [Anaeroplasmataceae bacterium]|nr:Type 1 glutamine amidotransferase-like domain-containing protein [Anaeroplasmataceae bacterium]
MAYYALLGGKSIPHIRDFSLEEKIFAHLNKKPKRILFVPLATYPDLQSSIKKFETLIDGKYEIDFLTEVKDPAEARRLFYEAEVIYFGGGKAGVLVEQAKILCIDALLKELNSTDKLFIGISAGAILFSKLGMGDQYVYKNNLQMWNYKMVEGLGILPITVCPHYDHDGLECYNDVVKKYPYCGYALEDDTAICFDSEVFVFKGDSKKSVYFFDLENDFIMKPLYERIKKRSLYKIVK